ncbi:MAG: hypothetical protein LBB12_02370, partial [Holosporaceae bacterium]|nr:hypothetical protein [Holosporaceae bacterium]
MQKDLETEEKLNSIEKLNSTIKYTYYMPYDIAQFIVQESKDKLFDTRGITNNVYLDLFDKALYEMAGNP